MDKVEMEAKAYRLIKEINERTQALQNSPESQEINKLNQELTELNQVLAK